jgi:hypothetical protein
MLKKISLFIGMAVLASFIGHLTQAIPVRAEVWQKKGQDGNYTFLYCFYDIHFSALNKRLDKMTPSLQNFLPSRIPSVSIRQRKELCAALNKDKDSVVLAEDMSVDINSKTIPSFAKSMFDISRDTEFLSLAQDCMESGITMINLECRQNKAMLYNYFSCKQFGKEPGFLAPSCQSAEEETDAVIEEIKNYDNGIFLNLYTTKELKKYEQSRKQFLEEFSQKGSYNIISAIYRDIPLLDIRAINHINMLSHKKRIVLAMGGAHIDRITPLLPVLGYEKVAEAGCTADEKKNILALLDAFDMNTWETEQAKKLASSQLIRLFEKALLMDIEKLMKEYRPLATIAIPQITDTKPLYDADMLLVSAVQNNATRLPFCVLVPTVAQYLKEKAQRDVPLIIDDNPTIMSLTQK